MVHKVDAANSDGSGQSGACKIACATHTGYVTTNSTDSPRSTKRWAVLARHVHSVQERTRRGRVRTQALRCKKGLQPEQIRFSALWPLNRQSAMDRMQRSSRKAVKNVWLQTHKQTASECKCKWIKQIEINCLNSGGISVSLPHPDIAGRPPQIDRYKDR